MSPTPNAVRVAHEYNMGLIWATSAFCLLLIIMAWYAGSLVPIVDQKLLIFLLWLHVVPLGALTLHRLLS